MDSEPLHGLPPPIQQDLQNLNLLTQIFVLTLQEEKQFEWLSCDVAFVGGCKADPHEQP